MNIKDITVVILLFHTRENLIENLKRYKDFKVIILDQSNDFNLKRQIKKLLPKVRYYLSPKGNLGFAKGINFLSKKVKTKYFLCTQPDVKINRISIENLKKTFNKKKDCIISVPKIRDYKNYNNKKREKIYSVKNIIGAIFLADKKKFIKIKMFDENFFFYWEDVDLSTRVHKSKYNIYINHNSNAVHTWTSTKFNFRTFAIKKTNFKFGEFLYQYKNNKLKYIKVLRQPIAFFVLIFFHLMIFNPKKAFENFFYLYGIIKFVTVILIPRKFNWYS